MKILRSAIATALLLPVTAQAQESNDQGWYLKPLIAISQLSDQTGTTFGIGAVDGSADAQISGGFASGLNIGYSYNEHWSAELGWEYRSNDSEVSLADGQRFTEGNYASNSFFLNGIYSFDSSRSWRPYLGAGLSWIQEIDIDLETAGSELSYSGDGDSGFQLFAGLDYQFDSRWSVLGEVRYSSIGDIELIGENTSGTFTGLDYNPVSFQIGLNYRF
jgi:outer membrane autotransporter protein